MGEVVVVAVHAVPKSDKKQPAPWRRPGYNMAGLVPIPSDLNDPNRFDWSAVK